MRGVRINLQRPSLAQPALIAGFFIYTLCLHLDLYNNTYQFSCIEKFVIPLQCVEIRRDRVEGMTVYRPEVAFQRPYFFCRSERLTTKKNTNFRDSSYCRLHISRKKQDWSFPHSSLLETSATLHQGLYHYGILIIK